MLFRRGARVFGAQWHSLGNAAAPRLATTCRAGQQLPPPRAAWFHGTARALAVKPVMLADIGEGIVECEITQWFVEPGARVEEFSPLCEVQSDKASVEITSRFTGVVKKLYYEAGEMAKVGKPFVDIDVKDDNGAAVPGLPGQGVRVESSASDGRVPEEPRDAQTTAQTPAPAEAPPAAAKGKCADVATPAVRHLCKALGVDVWQIDGTGKNGRVTKEDVNRFAQDRDSSPSASLRAAEPPTGPPPTADEQRETVVKMANYQIQMFKTMTRSLAIPHFLYSDEVDFSALHELRTRLNRVLARSASSSSDAAAPEQVAKLTYLPFIVKAVSMALNRYPILNARVDVDPSAPPGRPPSVVLRSMHNVGVAVDTPSGLVVPVLRNVGALNVLDIAAELSRLQKLAVAGKLGPRDLSGGTITVSNIGGIGGTYLSPVIVEREVAILGIGRTRTVPAFADDESDRVVRKLVCNFSWSADHRIVDGATMARASEIVRRVVEEPDVMVMHLR